MKVSVKLKPFMVPNYALIKVLGSSASDQPLSLPLRELDWGALDSLCREFRTNVFKKAKQEDKKP